MQQTTDLINPTFVATQSVQRLRMNLNRCHQPQQFWSLLPLLQHGRSDKLPTANPLLRIMPGERNNNEQRYSKTIFLVGLCVSSENWLNLSIFPLQLATIRSQQTCKAIQSSSFESDSIQLCLLSNQRKGRHLGYRWVCRSYSIVRWDWLELGGRPTKQLLFMDVTRPTAILSGTSLWNWIDTSGAQGWCGSLPLYRRLDT